MGRARINSNEQNGQLGTSQLQINGKWGKRRESSALRVHKRRMLVHFSLGKSPAEGPSARYWDSHGLSLKLSPFKGQIPSFGEQHRAKDPKYLTSTCPGGKPTFTALPGPCCRSCFHPPSKGVTCERLAQIWKGKEQRDGLRPMPMIGNILIPESPVLVQTISQKNAFKNPKLVPFPRPRIP